MTDDRYDKVTFRGVTVDKYTRAALLVVEHELGYQLTIEQGSYHKGVSKSAGTHDGGGAIDLVGSYDATNKVKALRRNGFVADLRTKAQGLSGEIHAIQIGNTKASPSAKAQIAPMERGRAGLARDQSQVIKYTPPGGYKPFDYKAAITPPPAPKPVEKHDPWFTLTLWPLAGFDVVYGEKHWPTLEPKIAKEIGVLGGEVFGLTEVPGPRVDEFDHELRKLGYRIAVTTDGRTIVVADSVKVGRVKKITLKEKGPAKDDKQIVLAEIWPTTPGLSWLVEVGHLEHRAGAAYDEARVTQGKETKATTLEVAERWGIPSSRVVFANDENSGSWVRDKAFNPDYDDAAELAEKTTNTAFATICGWSGDVAKGDATDRVEVHHSRPVISTKVIVETAPKKLTDHLPTRVVLGKN